MVLIYLQVASAFVVVATQHGGQESALQTVYNTLLHHGMLVSGAPYTDARLSQVDEVAGGSPYGAGSVEGGNCCAAWTLYTNLLFQQMAREFLLKQNSDLPDNKAHMLRRWHEEVSAENNRYIV